MNIKIIPFFLCLLFLFACGGSATDETEEAEAVKPKSTFELMQQAGYTIQESWEFDYLYGMPDTTRSGFLSYSKEYDKSGNLMLEKQFYKEDYLQDIAYVRRYEYDAQGNNTRRVEYAHSGEKKSEMVAKYQDTLMLEQKVMSDKNGSYITTYEYDVKGLLQASQQTSLDLDFRRDFTYQYDEEDRFTESTELNEEGQVVGYVAQTYNDLGRASLSSFDADRKLIWTSVVKKPNDSTVVEMSNLAGETPDIKYSYYNKLGMLKEFIDSTSYGVRSHYTRHFTPDYLPHHEIEYDEKGEPLKFILYRYR